MIVKSENDSSGTMSPTTPPSSSGGERNTVDIMPWNSTLEEKPRSNALTFLLRQFHDRILSENQMPIGLLRALIKKEHLTHNFRP